MAVAQVPSTRDELCTALAAAAESGTPVRFRGGGTKQAWPPPPPEGTLELSTSGLNKILEHNAGDLTAVLEAGVPLAEAQAVFAKEGQMLALDPPDPGGATVGGVVASGDTGPLRGRYGGPRDLVVGMRVALSDGTLAKSGGKVIKNVAGYDIAKLFAGSLGTLGAIVELSVRLHPIAPVSATARGVTVGRDDIARAAIVLASSPLEHQGFDLHWHSDRGMLMMRFAGVTPRPQAEAAVALMEEQGLKASVTDDDGRTWDFQRDSQRGPLVVKVSTLPSRLGDLLRISDRYAARVVGRAALGLYWIKFEEPSAEPIEQLRESGFVAVVQDRPPDLDVDRTGPLPAAAAALMERVKQRFDPAGVCV